MCEQTFSQPIKFEIKVIVFSQVRWADINERKNQQRMRDVGFVVGQTDWSRMMDDSHATQALNRTKFI